MKFAILCGATRRRYGCGGRRVGATGRAGERERYCIEVIDHSGSNPWLCRFETYEQCLASKTSPQDKCWLNPYLAFQQRR